MLLAGGFGNLSFFGGNTTSTAPAAFGANTNAQTTGFGSTSFGQPSNQFGAPGKFYFTITFGLTKRSSRDLFFI